MRFPVRLIASAAFRRRLACAIAIALAFAAASRVFAASAPVSDVSTHAAHAMVVAENDDAARAGVEILRAGGDAVDAACATALAVGVTNAASCGIGGGGFMLIYIAKERQFYALDYRECAPLKASPDMYMRDGHPDEALARDGFLAVATPGEIAGIDAALRRFGKLKFQAVAAPAVRLARDGFVVTPHMAGEIAHFAPELAHDDVLRAVFFAPDGSAPKAGDKIANPRLAATLEALGDDPVTPFYHGAAAAELASFMSAHGGLLSAQDLAEYRPQWCIPVHRMFEDYGVYAMPPPSSGGVVLEMLGALEGGHLAGLGLNSPPYLARLIEVMRAGFRDREQYADPAFFDVPIVRLLSPENVNALRDRALHHKLPPPAPASAAHDHGTSNLLVADGDGNVVALTTTINTPFGAKVMEPKLGILLNDEMDDFSVGPGVPNAYRLAGVSANSIAPGKRPLSSMTPIIVTKDGKPVMTVGGSGGPTIITGVLQVTLNILESHLGPGAAAAAPRIHEQGIPDLVIVEEAMPEVTRKALTEMGYKLRVVPQLGAVGAMTIAPGNLRGAFDPRKGGGAEGF
jgi:gamma-glutamyltranspeptidase/glutathione hydrolase